MADLGPFQRGFTIAVAVSGGPDSLCLALLLNGWALALGGHVVALTVDHGLRPESRSEALQVGQWLSARGMDHHILDWAGAKPSSAIQTKARDARYDLMGDWCERRNIRFLALGHQLQDQAETLLLRLRQGSGLDGLASMAARRQRGNVCLLRPLLGVPRDRLIATLAAWNQPYIDDPSNKNPRYERVRMRSLMAGLGLSAQGLADTARVLGQARQTMAALVDRAEALLVSHHAMGFAVVDGAGLQSLPPEVGLRLLSRLVQRIGGAVYPPRSDRLERLFQTQNGTLAGCRVVPRPEGILVLCREQRGIAPFQALEAGQRSVWDGRFSVAVAAECPVGFSIGALGSNGWEMLIKSLEKKERPIVPAILRTTIPSIWYKGLLSSVPQLGYKSSKSACIFVDCHYFSIEALTYNQAH